VRWNAEPAEVSAKPVSDSPSDQPMGYVATASVDPSQRQPHPAFSSLVEVAEYGGGQQTESRNLLGSQANSLPLLTFLPGDRHK